MLYAQGVKSMLVLKFVTEHFGTMFSRYSQSFKFILHQTRGRYKLLDKQQSAKRSDSPNARKSRMICRFVPREGTMEHDGADEGIYIQGRGSAKRLTDLPVVTKRVGDASNPPTMVLGNSYDFSCSCGNGLLEHRVRVVYGQDHPNG